MTTSTRTIHVAPGSELDRLLQDATDGPFELEKDGVRYRVERVEAVAEEDIGPTTILRRRARESVRQPARGKAWLILRNSKPPSTAHVKKAHVPRIDREIPCR